MFFDKPFSTIWSEASNTGRALMITGIILLVAVICFGAVEGGI